MSYNLNKFGQTDLPKVNAEPDVGTGPAKSDLVNIPGGWFDPQGTAQADAQTHIIPLACALIGATKTALDDAYDTVRALKGVRDKLWRLRADGDIQWIWARMIEIQAVRDYRVPHRLPMTISFQRLSPLWNGLRSDDGWLLDAGDRLDEGLYLDGTPTVLNTSPKNITVTNSGNATVKNAVITVTAVGTDITALTIAKSGETQLVYSGTIAAGESLVIDCGAWSVENDGTDDYANFALGASHAIEEWLHLEPGNNTITVTKTGGGTTSTIGFTYYDGWQ